MSHQSQVALHSSYPFLGKRPVLSLPALVLFSEENVNAISLLLATRNMEGVTLAATPGMELKEEVGTFVLPGETVGTLVDSTSQVAAHSQGQKRAVVRLGTGVTQRQSYLHSVKAGLVNLDSRRNKVWIESNQKRYVPALEDMVIGVVIERHSEECRVDINGTDTATLPALAFEGATKKNKPNLVIGSVVYCRITRASKNMEAEASCIEPGSSKSWAGGETLFGELKGGNIVQVSLALARALLMRDNPILSLLGSKTSFQSAVGVNGRVWIQAASVEHTVFLSMALEKADIMSVKEWTKFVNDLLD